MSSDMEQKAQEQIEGGISENDRLRSELEALRAELSDALARVGELTLAVGAAHELADAFDAELEYGFRQVLARPTLGAASRLRDEVLEEAIEDIDCLIKYWASKSNGMFAQGILNAAKGNIRARKSKETDR